MSSPDSNMAHYRDLREVYARHMEFHGCGFGLFQPISGRDLAPLTAGFFDRNGDWNLIANLRTDETQGAARGRVRDEKEPWTNGFAPLESEPRKSAEIEISWQPKTSLGVQQYNIEGSGSSPDNLPGGADAHIKYSTKQKFGAVLMTIKPVTLTAYNQERLFLKWLDDNRDLLLERHGAELKRYGLWLVTRTYTSQGCSINAWRDSGKAAIVSAKAKASMLGELGENLDWSDQLTDRDWSHYRAKGPEGVVVFMDGIHVKASTWWFDELKRKISGSASRSRSSRSLSRSRSASASGQRRRRSSTSRTPEARRQSLRVGRSDDEEDDSDATFHEKYGLLHPAPESVPQSSRILRLPSTKQALHPDDAHYNQQQQQQHHYEHFGDEDQVLKDIGFRDPLRRSSSSAKRSSYAGSTGSGTNHSLRRESRTISQEYQMPHKSYVL